MFVWNAAGRGLVCWVNIILFVSRTARGSTPNQTAHISLISRKGHVIEFHETCAREFRLGRINYTIAILLVRSNIYKLPYRPRFGNDAYFSVVFLFNIAIPARYAFYPVYSFFGTRDHMMENSRARTRTHKHRDTRIKKRYTQPLIIHIAHTHTRHTSVVRLIISVLLLSIFGMCGGSLCIYICAYGQISTTTLAHHSPTSYVYKLLSRAIFSISNRVARMI